MPDNSCPSEGDQQVDTYLGNAKRYQGSATSSVTTAQVPTAPNNPPLAMATATTNSTLTTDIPENNDLYRRNGNTHHSPPLSAPTLKMEPEVEPHGNTTFSSATLPKWYQLSTWWILILMAIMVASIGSLVIILDSFTHHQKDTIGCRESYMRPLYVKQDGFDSEMTRFAEKYALYLYREKGVDLSEQVINRYKPK